MAKVILGGSRKWDDITADAADDLHFGDSSSQGQRVFRNSGAGSCLLATLTHAACTERVKDVRYLPSACDILNHRHGIPIHVRVHLLKMRFF